MTNNLELYPENYWHCSVKLVGQKKHAVANDLTFTELHRQIIEPWLQVRAFTISGAIITPQSSVEEIKITHTIAAQEFYAQKHNAEAMAAGILDLVTDRRLLPLKEGRDYTYELLFSGKAEVIPEAGVALIEQVCRRIGHTARILANRQRIGSNPFIISNEYDVQDLLHGVLRAFIKFSVQEDPLHKVAGARASRADISIEDLGILIEIKYVHGPDDQKRIFDDFSKDLVLYSSWKPLKTLLFLIYNSADLRDPEALEKLSGIKEINGTRFDTRIILS